MAARLGGALPRLCKPVTLSLFAALAALCTQHAAAQVGIEGGTTTYTETFQHPRLEYTLSTFMREPGNLLALTRPAYSMEVVSGTCTKDGTEALREWLYTQTVAVGNRAGGSAITMIYAGMEDGTFVGYFDPDSYTFRAAGESRAGASEQIWAPHADAADVPGDKGPDDYTLGATCAGSATPASRSIFCSFLLSLSLFF